MSDTTELFTGSSGVPEESPGYSGHSGLSATAGAGTAAGAPAGPAAGETVTDKPARRGGSGLSGMLLADLQRLAQSMGITGTGRLRKSQLIEAIQSKQGGGGAAPSAPGGVSAGPSAGNGSGTLDNSVQRGASAGAGAPRHREQDAMESDTTTQPALGNAAQSSGPAQEADPTTREARRAGPATRPRLAPPDRVLRPTVPTASSRSPRAGRRQARLSPRPARPPTEPVTAPGGPTASRTASAAASAASAAGVTTPPATVPRATGESSARASVTVTSVTAASETAAATGARAITASVTTASAATAGTASAARR